MLIALVVLAYGVFIACGTTSDIGSEGRSIQPADSQIASSEVDAQAALETNGLPSEAEQLVLATRSAEREQVGEPIFYDGFEYVVGREDARALAIFREEGGWSRGKTQQDPASRNPRGFVYTTDDIPGYTGKLPGRNSARVLALEALPTTLGNARSDDWGDMQTDFYLQYGSETGSTSKVPADVWFQFWIYPTGNFDRGMKLIYPCRIHYPCSDGQWLVTLGSTSQEPYWEEFSIEGEPVPDIFLQLYAVDAKYQPSISGADGNDLGQTDTSVYLKNGHWVLVTLHIDTSGDQGVYEAWLKPLHGREVKVAEFIGGVTDNFDWPIRDKRGHSQFRMPTTVGGPRALNLYPRSYDSILYIDDFAMASSRAALPHYP